ncbi:MAG: glycine cleavage system protein GcvH, partial [Thermoplasmata archaeon]
EWVKAEGDLLVLGITDHAQSELTDIVFVDLPAVGKAVGAKASVLVLESVKTVADVYAPVASSVAGVNSDLTAHPELVNQDPYGKGWLVKLRPTAPFDPASLLTAEQYRAAIATPASP